MNKITLIIPLIALSLFSCANKSIDPKKIDLYKKEIMYDETGKNIVATDEYEYNNKGLCIKDTHIDLDYPNIKTVYEYSYDDHENEIGLHYFEFDGEEKTDVGWTVTEYTYDNQNRITKQVTKMSFDGEEWVDFESYEYEYQENVTIEKSYVGDGKLECTTTYTYDEKGNLINEKKINTHDPINPTYAYDSEKVYTVDEYGCTTTIVEFIIASSGEREEMSSVTAITYLNNLWYRPLKETVTDCETTNSTTIEREYDNKNRLKLYKIYNGTEEGPTPSYIYYATYEY